MQTSNLALAAILLVIPFGAAAGCLDPGTCIRNSDCPAIDVCSQGACILAPPDNPLDGGDEAGDEASTTYDSGSAPDAVSPGDATVGTDAHTDASGDARADATDTGASDAGGAGD